VQTTAHNIDLDGGRVLHIREWPGEGHPVVLLHGLLDSCAGWTALAAASSRRCLAFDLPGFGLSSVPQRPRLSAYADDVVAGLRRLKVGSCTLVGHSLGGGVATAVAERLGDDVMSLVLCAPVGFGRLPLAEFAGLPVVRELAARALPHVLAKPSLVGAVYASMVTDGRAPTEELRQRLAADAHRAAPGVRAALEALAAAARSPRAFYRRTVRFGGRVTVGWGDRDALVPVSHVRGVLAALPQAQICVWPGMGHHPQRERPGALAALVSAACEDAGARPATPERHGARRTHASAGTRRPAPHEQRRPLAPAHRGSTVLEQRRPAAPEQRRSTPHAHRSGPPPAAGINSRARRSVGHKHARTTTRARGKHV
jgi:pimeloyl-ACP methyl ester carboxylesterase